MSNSHEPRGPRRADFQQALQSMGTYTDITVDDLMTLAQELSKSPVAAQPGPSASVR